MDISELNAISQFVENVDIDGIENNDVDKVSDMVTPDSCGGVVHPCDGGAQVLRDQHAVGPPNQGKQADDPRSRARLHEQRYRIRKKEEVMRKRQQTIATLEEEYASVRAHAEEYNAQWRYTTNVWARSVRPHQLQEECSLALESCQKARETANREKWPAPFISQIREVTRALRHLYSDLDEPAPVMYQ